MTDLDLDAIEARANAATEGPWECLDLSDADFDSKNERGWWWVWRAGIQHYAGVLNTRDRDEAGVIGEASITDSDDGDQERADAEFIAHARTDVPALVAEVRAERAKLEKVFQYCLDSAYADINPYEIADLIGRGDELASKRDAVFDD